MAAIRRFSVVAASGGLVLATGMLFPSSVGFASEAPTMPTNHQITAPVFPVAPAAAISAPDVKAVEPAAPAANPADAVAAPAATPAKLSDTALDPELECLAKAVHYEASNQPRQGQLAVAQVVLNRTTSGRFPRTVCGVINQPGQFFKTASYNPRRVTGQWRAAVDAARTALGGAAKQAAQGALYFHAARVPAGWFKTRQRVMKLGDHIFYR